MGLEAGSTSTSWLSELSTKKKAALFIAIAVTAAAVAGVAVGVVVAVRGSSSGSTVSGGGAPPPSSWPAPPPPQSPGAPPPPSLSPPPPSSVLVPPPPLPSPPPPRPSPPLQPTPPPPLSLRSPPPQASPASPPPPTPSPPLSPHPVLAAHPPPAAFPPPPWLPPPAPSPPSPSPPLQSPSPPPPPLRPLPPPSVPAPPPPAQIPDPPEGWTTLWFDEFNGDKLDTSKWGFDLGNGDWGWGNNELQSYTSDTANVRVEGGSLLITALKAQDGSYTSGRINTKASASFVPGMTAQGRQWGQLRVEGRLRVPSPPAQGLWPAFWMFPLELKYGAWPASGEIDVCETKNTMSEVTQVVWWGGPGWQDQWPVATANPNGGPYSDSYHVFSVDWSADTIAYAIDGQTTHIVHSAASPAGQAAGRGWYTNAPGAGPQSPYDQPFYIILNLAVGGLFPQPPDATTQFPATLAVDYVRVYGK